MQLLALALRLQSAWIDPQAVRLEGYERVQGSRERPFTILRSGPDVRVETEDGIEGFLSGLKRVEMKMRTGAVTWLVSKPAYALNMPGLSNDEWEAMTRPPRFTKEDLATRPELVAKTLGKLIYIKDEEAISGRDCFVFRLSAGSSVQNLWLDKQTGIVLKREDTDGQTVYFTRRIESMALDPQFEPSLLFMPKTQLLHGLPSPEILLYIDLQKTDKQIVQEINAAKARSELATNWVKTPPAIPNYRYVSTSYKETKAIPSTQKIANPLAAPELQPGGLPPGWTVKGQVDPLNGHIFYSFDSEGAKPSVLTALPKKGEPSTFSLTVGNESVEFVSYIAPDGTLVIAPGNDADKAEESRRFRRENSAGSGAWMQSDFVLDSTGDTASFVQLRNRKLTSVMRGLVPPTPTKKGKYEVYQLSLPIRLNIVSWQEPQAVYAFWSSALTVEELMELANRTR